MPRRYVVLYLPSHPLAGTTGLVTEHRTVLFDAIGPGEHPCHWCGKTVVWILSSSRGVRRGELTVDHLDNDPKNNALENLVPSCHGCNCHRSRRVRDGEVFVLRKNGKRARAVERVCQHCSNTFAVITSSAAVGEGKFCSPECSSAERREAGFCKNGHARTEENTYLWSDERRCRECTREAGRRHDMKRRSGV